MLDIPEAPRGVLLSDPLEASETFRKELVVMPIDNLKFEWPTIRPLTYC